MAAAAATTGSMRILCLHGYAKSRQYFYKATRAFRKLVKTLPSGRSVHFEFLNAPHMSVNDQAMEVNHKAVEVNHQAPDDPEPDDPEPDDTEPDDDEDIGENNSGLRCLGGIPPELEMFTWWFSKSPDGFAANEPSEWEHGLKDSLALVVRELRKRPYAGLMGFGQGAAMAFMVLRHMEMEMEQDPVRPKFGLLFAPFKSRCTPHEAYFADQLRTPCLVVSGKTDAIIPESVTSDLLPLFAKLSFLGHSEGHKVPAKSKLKDKYLEFLSTFDFDTVPYDSFAMRVA